MSTIPGIRLDDDTTVPQLGVEVRAFGRSEVTTRGVLSAIVAGHRHVDTMPTPDSESGAGRAIARSGLARRDLWVTARTDGRYPGADARRALAASLRRLGLDFVDQYLLDGPGPDPSATARVWRELERARDEGTTRSVGVANFGADALARLVRDGDVPPSVNQVELHPRWQRVPLRAVHRRSGVRTTAWDPFGHRDYLVTDPTLGAIAARHHRTPVQVLLGWHLRLGHVVVCPLSGAARLADDLAAAGELRGDRVAGGDTPGGDTPGGDTPSATPGGDTPGGDTPGGDTPSASTPGGDTPSASTPGDRALSDAEMAAIAALDRPAGHAARILTANHRPAATDVRARDGSRPIGLRSWSRVGSVPGRGLVQRA
ncbi:MAG TPA: aldo/keto reductase [Pseudonocardia sp.]